MKKISLCNLLCLLLCWGALSSPVHAGGHSAVLSGDPAYHDYVVLLQDEKGHPLQGLKLVYWGLDTFVTNAGGQVVLEIPKASLGPGDLMPFTLADPVYTLVQPVMGIAQAPKPIEGGVVADQLVLTAGRKKKGRKLLTPSRIQQHLEQVLEALAEHPVREILFRGSLSRQYPRPAYAWEPYMPESPIRLTVKEKREIRGEDKGVVGEWIEVETLPYHEQVLLPYFRTWAKHYGISVAEVMLVFREQAEAWQGSKALEEQGLAAVYFGRYADAGALFTQAGDRVLTNGRRLAEIKGKPAGVENKLNPERIMESIVSLSVERYRHACQAYALSDSVTKGLQPLARARALRAFVRDSIEISATVHGMAGVVWRGIGLPVDKVDEERVYGPEDALKRNKAQKLMSPSHLLGQKLDLGALRMAASGFEKAAWWYRAEGKHWAAMEADLQLARLVELGFRYSLIVLPLRQGEDWENQLYWANPQTILSVLSSKIRRVSVLDYHEPGMPRFIPFQQTVAAALVQKCGGYHRNTGLFRGRETFTVVGMYSSPAAFQDSLGFAIEMLKDSRKWAEFGGLPTLEALSAMDLGHAFMARAEAAREPGIDYDAMAVISASLAKQYFQRDSFPAAYESVWTGMASLYYREARNFCIPKAIVAECYGRAAGQVQTLAPDIDRVKRPMASMWARLYVMECRILAALYRGEGMLAAQSEQYEAEIRKIMDGYRKLGSGSGVIRGHYCLGLLKELRKDFDGATIHYELAMSHTDMEGLEARIRYVELMANELGDPETALSLWGSHTSRSFRRLWRNYDAFFAFYLPFLNGQGLTGFEYAVERRVGKLYYMQPVYRLLGIGDALIRADSVSEKVMQLSRDNVYGDLDGVEKGFGVPFRLDAGIERAEDALRGKADRKWFLEVLRAFDAHGRDRMMEVLRGGASKD